MTDFAKVDVVVAYSENADFSESLVHEFKTDSYQVTEHDFLRKLTVPTGDGSTGGVTLELGHHAAGTRVVIQNVGVADVLLKYQPPNDTAIFANMTHGNQFNVLYKNPYIDGAPGNVYSFVVKPGADLSLYASGVAGTVVVWMTAAS